jgi:hypothetical protein
MYLGYWADSPSGVCDADKPSMMQGQPILGEYQAEIMMMLTFSM